MDKQILHRAYKLAYGQHTKDQYDVVVKWFDLALQHVEDTVVHDELERLAFIVLDNANGNVFTRG